MPATHTCPPGSDVADTVVAEAAALSTERLEAEITSLAGHIAAATCRWLLYVAEFDRREGWGAWECRSGAHWLMWHCGMSLRTAQDHLRVAHALEALPQVRAHFASGILSYSKVRAITRVAEPRTEDFFLNYALNGTTSQLERAVTSYRTTDQLDDQDANDRHSGRSTLTEDADGVCHLENSANLAPETARRLACDATTFTIVTGPDGKATLVEKASKTIPPMLRREVDARDHGCCRIPGCGAVGYTHMHHIVHRAHHGPNELGNLITLCGFHHRLLHEGGYRVELAGGQVLLHRPGCSPLVDRPASAPSGPGITASNLDLGVNVEPTTIVSRWDGTRLTHDDLSFAIAAVNAGLSC